MYFTQINDTRRFKVIGDVFAGVLAPYDQKVGGHIVSYAPIGADAAGNLIFVGAPVYYFDDELEELF